MPTTTKLPPSITGAARLAGSSRYDLYGAPANPDAWTERDVARALGVSIETVRCWRKRKQGPKYYYVGDGVRPRLFYRHSDVVAWDKARRKVIEPSAAGPRLQTKHFKENQQ